MSQKKDDLPAMPFYVGDWLKAPDIQCLNYELKGLWFEMLCFMWESKERGVLLYTKEELSRLLRLPEDLLEQKLKQIGSKGIYSVRDNDGAIYCRRMVRDQEIREIRTIAGQKGGRRSFAKRFAQAKVEAICENESDIANGDFDTTTLNKAFAFNFEDIWSKYPSRIGKKEALRHFKASVKTEKDFDDIHTALNNYLRSARVAKGIIQNGSTWFNNWKDWLDIQTATGKSQAMLDMERMIEDDRKRGVSSLSKIG